MTSCKLKNSTKGQSKLKLLEVVLVVVVETEKHQSSETSKICTIKFRFGVSNIMLKLLNSHKIYT
jgi:hypothetical protein